VMQPAEPRVVDVTDEAELAASAQVDVQWTRKTEPRKAERKRGVRPARAPEEDAKDESLEQDPERERITAPRPRLASGEADERSDCVL
jgi:hypothetical protein